MEHCSVGVSCKTMYIPCKRRVQFNNIRQVIKVVLLFHMHCEGELWNDEAFVILNFTYGKCFFFWLSPYMQHCNCYSRSKQNVDILWRSLINNQGISATHHSQHLEALNHQIEHSCEPTIQGKWLRFSVWKWIFKCKYTLGCVNIRNI